MWHCSQLYVSITCYDDVSCWKMSSEQTRRVKYRIAVRVLKCHMALKKAFTPQDHQLKYERTEQSGQEGGKKRFSKIAILGTVMWQKFVSSQRFCQTVYIKIT